jgi:glycosyltransferase involved in cell wall biosynthesis
VALPPSIPVLFHILLGVRLANRALSLQPDVVHFFKPKAYAGLAHLLLWWLRRLKRISVGLVVDSDDWEQAWNDLLPYTRWQKMLFRWQEQWGIHHADVMTVASRALEILVHAERGGSEGVFYLPNGFLEQRATDLTRDEIRSQLRAALGQAPLILLYSRFAEFRLSRVVMLVKLVAQQMPRARWLIVGQGLHGEDQRLAEQLSAASMADRVQFAGWQTPDRLPGYFEVASVAVHPYDDTTINRTKCSVKLIDLLLAGVPVVADRVGQNSEYIENGISGVLVTPEDDVAMAGAIVELLQSPDKQESLATMAQKTVRDRFNWTSLAQIAEQAYRWIKSTR